MIDLLNGSSSTRQYFLSLSAETQLILHKYNEYIRSAQELRLYVDAAIDYERHVLLSAGSGGQTGSINM